MKTFCSKLLMGAVAAIAMSASSAQAAITVASNIGGPDVGPPAGYTVVLDYDSINTGFFTQSGTFGVTTAPGNPDAAAPFGTPAGTNFAYASTGQYADLIAPVITGFSFYLGSIDGFNHIAFFDGAMQLADFDGAMLAPPANGIQDSPATNRRITFDFGGATATRVRIFSDGISTEWDTIAVPSSVPEPATWAMMITGFGLLGAALRRRRQLGAVAA